MTERSVFCAGCRNLIDPVAIAMTKRVNCLTLVKGLFTIGADGLAGVACGGTGCGNSAFNLFVGVLASGFFALVNNFNCGDLGFSLGGFSGIADDKGYRAFIYVYDLIRADLYTVERKNATVSRFISDFYRYDGATFACGNHNCSLFALINSPAMVARIIFTCMGRCAWSCGCNDNAFVQIKGWILCFICPTVFLSIIFNGNSYLAFLLRLGLGDGSTGSGGLFGLGSGYFGLRSGYFGLGSGYFGLGSSYFRLGSSYFRLGSSYFGLRSGYFGLGSGYFGLGSGYFGLGSRSFGSRTFGSRTFGSRTFGSRSFGSGSFGSGSFGGTLLRSRSTFLGLGNTLLGSFFGSFLRSLFGSRGSFGSQRDLADLVQLFPPCELACNVVARRHRHEEHKG